MKKPFGPRAHGVIDYGFTAIQLLAPSLFKLKGTARTLSYAFGVGAGLLNGSTDQPFAVIRAIPFQVHGQIDGPFVAILLLLPWTTGALKQRNARRFFLSFFAATLTNYLLTDFNASEGERL